MKDREKEFISVKDNYGNHKYTISVARLYADFKDQLIEEGFIEANPKRWVRPDLNDIKWYFSDKGSDDLEAVKFFDYWDSLDWKRGKARIKNWKLTANTWIKNNEKYKGSNPGAFVKTSAADQIAASIANRN